METTMVYWGYIGIMKKKMETTIFLQIEKACHRLWFPSAGQCRVVEDIFHHGYGVWESRSIRAVAVKGRDLLHAKWPCRQTARVGANFFSVVARDDTKRHVELGKKAGFMGVALS